MCRDCTERNLMAAVYTLLVDHIEVVKFLAVPRRAQVLKKISYFIVWFEFGRKASERLELGDLEVNQHFIL